MPDSCINLRCSNFSVVHSKEAKIAQDLAALARLC